MKRAGPLFLFVREGGNYIADEWAVARALPLFAKGGHPRSPRGNAALGYLRPIGLAVGAPDTVDCAESADAVRHQQRALRLVGAQAITPFAKKDRIKAACHNFGARVSIKARLKNLVGSEEWPSTRGIS
jgi:hypothetical protein